MDNLQKWAGVGDIVGLGGGMLSRISGPALYALAALPVVAGGTVGYGLSKMHQPERQDFRNLGKEQLLAEIQSQIADTRKLNETRKEREEVREEGSTDVGDAAGREIHIPT